MYSCLAAIECHLPYGMTVLSATGHN